MGSQIPESGGRIFWPGTNATIPGIGVTWEEDTAFAERYLQGDTTTYAGPANAGGSHTHTSADHQHDGVAHTHDITADGTTHTVAMAATVNRDTECSDDAHGHVLVESASTSISYGNQDAHRWPTDTNHPPHVEVLVIGIVAAAGDQDIPDDAVVLGLTTPAGFATLGDLDDKFLRAPADGGDSDLTGAGSADHTHTETGAHFHLGAAHVHADVDAGASDLTHLVDAGTPGLTRKAVHHNVSLQSQATNSGGVWITSDASSSEPAYIKLLPLQVTGAQAPVDDSTIIPYVGTHAALAALSGWELYAPADSLQVKCTTDGDVGTTGGSNTHGHTSSHAHGPDWAAHTHYETVTDDGAQAVDPGLQDVILLTKDAAEHTHTWNVSSEQPATQSQSVKLSDEDGRPPYRTVLWIRKVAPAKRVTLGTIHRTTKEVLAA